jgi:hypothetical protein
MSTEYFINQVEGGLLSRAEGRCAVDGVAGQLTSDQLWALRGPLVLTSMLDEPATRMNVDPAARVAPFTGSPEIHHGYFSLRHPLPSGSLIEGRAPSADSTGLMHCPKSIEVLVREIPGNRPARQ